MSYTQGILVSVSSILNISLMSKQTVGFFPTLHGTIQTIAIQTITVSEAIILKSKQTQGFSLLAKETVSVFLYLNDSLFAGSIWNSFFFSFSSIFAPIYSLFLLLLNLFKKKICCSSLVHYSTGDFIFTFDFDRADSLSELWVFSRPSN